MGNGIAILWAIGGAALAATIVGVMNRFIRFSLAAPRVQESGVPDGLPWEEVRIPTANGKTLFSWLISAGDKAPTLAILHGWGANAEMMLPLAKPLHEAGYTLLFLDARSHGRSDGDSFSSLPRFAEDLEHAIDWLKEKSNTPVERIGVIGHSVGAGAALLLASRRKNLAAVVSLAAFAHPATVMRRWLKQKRIPYWPFGAYILFYIQRVIGYRFDDIAPCNTIRQIDCPVLLVHGTDDETVPASEARHIHANRRDERTQLMLMPGSHDEYGEIEQQIATMLVFLNASLQPGAVHRARIATRALSSGKIHGPSAWDSG